MRTTIDRKKTPAVVASDCRSVACDLRSAEVKHGDASEKSLPIIVEMMPEELSGKRMAIRTTCLRAANLSSDGFQKSTNNLKKKVVYVLNIEGQPLMPTNPVKARLLLKTGKAWVKHREPFTIQLNYHVGNYKQDITQKIDPGSGKMGNAAMIEGKREIVYMSVVEVRNDIAEKMKRKSKYRRNRRNRKTRYRPARWLNRKNSIKSDRFSPTMRSKFDSHLKEIWFLRSILPITATIYEAGQFDPHALKNPEVLKNPLLYQQGTNWGFANSKAFVLVRDGYSCQNKGCKTKDKRKEVHHIIPRCESGSDEPENLVTLCKTCHDGILDGTTVLKMKGKKKGNLSHATQMNSINIQLLKSLPEAQITYGFETKECRKMLNLPKEHYYDAVAMGSGGKPLTFKTDEVFYKKCIAKGDYQRTKGVRSEQVLPKGKIEGFKKFDKVKFKGKEYFIKGRMSSGYAILMDVHGEKVDLKPIPKFTQLKRISARKSWIVAAEKRKTA